MSLKNENYLPFCKKINSGTYKTNYLLSNYNDTEYLSRYPVTSFDKQHFIYQNR